MSKNADFITYVQATIKVLENESCPSHLECGAQDAWLDDNSAEVQKYQRTLKFLNKGLTTDKDVFELAKEEIHTVMWEYIISLHQNLSNFIDDYEYEFYEGIKPKGD